MLKHNNKKRVVTFFINSNLNLLKLIDFIFCLSKFLFLQNVFHNKYLVFHFNKTLKKNHLKPIQIFFDIQF